MNRLETLAFLSCLPTTKPVLLRSPTGQGKSALVRELAAKLGYNLQVEYPAQREPTDFTGQPYLADEFKGRSSSKITCFARPHFWPARPKTLLLLEEVDRISNQMQPIVMQLVNERTAGGRSLPADTIVYATCNGERFMTQPMDQAEIRRFAVIDYSPTVAEWLDWAELVGIDPQILTYISQHPAALDTPEKLIGKRNRQIACRANWEAASDWLKNARLNKLDELDEKFCGFLTPFLGEAAAGDFASWAAGGAGRLDPDDIFDGKLDVENVSLLQASQAAAAIGRGFMSKSANSQARALDFYLNIGPECFACLFNQLPKQAAGVLKAHKRAHQSTLELLKSLK